MDASIRNAICTPSGAEPETLLRGAERVRFNIERKVDPTHADKTATPEQMARAVPAEVDHAGARTEDGGVLLDTRIALLSGEISAPFLADTDTTLAVVATAAALTKVQANRLDAVAQDGPRPINPMHAKSDGDLVFAIAACCVPLEGRHLGGKKRSAARGLQTAE